MRCWQSFLLPKRGIGISVQLIEGFRDEIADSLSRDAPWNQNVHWTGTHSNLSSPRPGSSNGSFRDCVHHQLPLYVAPKVDPLTAGTDALSLDWNQWKNIYMFPRFNLMVKVLDKLRTFKGTAAIAAPLWPQSNWYPLVLELKLRLVPLPSPTLKQTVQKKSVFTSS